MTDSLDDDDPGDDPGDGPLGIDRCFCFAAPFETLRHVAHATGARTVADLQQHAVFGRKCCLCHPYVRRMLRTGEVVFGSVVTADDEPEAVGEGTRR